MSAGIDYGMGQTNIDAETGIRYGCISMHSVSQAWADSSEADYGEPHCPQCGELVAEADPHGYVDPDTGDDYPQYEERGCQDYVCHKCGHTLDSEMVSGDEPAGYYLRDAEYEAVSCLDSDILITKSPYYTRAVFCSPCVPGACSIETPDPDGAKAYVFDHSWFESGVAPYPVYRVEDDTLVEAVVHAKV